ncbi:hypothetical protein E2C01_017886 [Portunus trituberculatus]|uniref:Uncharacterized protein n=1 Tax=Portunus trituberculatus TaxID=210409 RepID=A0A5B7DT10_PORTR|nr:hypothetical protein [Portunus trituberculatus]
MMVEYLPRVSLEALHHQAVFSVSWELPGHHVSQSREHVPCPVLPPWPARPAPNPLHWFPLLPASLRHLFLLTHRLVIIPEYIFPYMVSGRVLRSALAGDKEHNQGSSEGHSSSRESGSILKRQFNVFFSY